MAGKRRPDAETVIGGRLVRAWSRRSEIEVDVHEGETVDTPLAGEWGMPKAMGLEAAMRQAAAQT